MDGHGLRAADRRFVLLAASLALAGLALAAYRLGAQSLWLDETYTWWFTRLGWGDLLQAARIDAVNPPLYYLFVKLLASSASEAGLRAPSVAAHLAGIAGAIYLGFLVGGRPGGLAAGLVWATHPLTLWAARDARPYALSATLAVIVVALFVRLQRSWSTPLALLAGLVVALGLLTHYFFFVLLAALVALSAVDLRRAPDFFRRWTVLALLAMIPLALWLAWFFSTGTPSLGIGWIRAPVLGDIPLTMWNLASGYGGVSDVPSTLLGVTLILVAAAGLASSSRTLWARLALAGIVIPILAVWVVSQRRPVYVDRYFVVLLPIVIALVALGAAAIAHRTRAAAPIRTAAVLAAIVVALFAGLTVHRAEKFDKEDWRGLAAFLQSRGAGADSLSLSEPEITLPLSYYFAPQMTGETPRLLPGCGESCWWVLRQPYTATHALTQSVQEMRRDVLPAPPAECEINDSWLSRTGIATWSLACGS